MSKHSVGWNVAKSLAKKVRFHRTLNVVFSVALVSLLIAVAVLLFGGK